MMDYVIIKSIFIPPFSALYMSHKIHLEPHKVHKSKGQLFGQETPSPAKAFVLSVALPLYFVSYGITVTSNCSQNRPDSLLGY
jgi:hypothetical protein